MRRCLMLLCVLLAGGCSANPPHPGPAASGQTNAEPVEFDLYEPVVRYLLEGARRDAGDKRPVVHVALPEGFSAAQFCRRFQDVPFPVVARAAEEQQGAEKATFLICIQEVSGDKVQWEGPDEARVFAWTNSSAQPSTCGTPFPVRVKRDGGKWVVAER